MDIIEEDNKHASDLLVSANEMPSAYIHDTTVNITVNDGSTPMNIETKKPKGCLNKINAFLWRN